MQTSSHELGQDGRTSTAGNNNGKGRKSSLTSGQPLAFQNQMISLADLTEDKGKQNGVVSATTTAGLIRVDSTNAAQTFNGFKSQAEEFN